MATLTIDLSVFGPLIPGGESFCVRLREKLSRDPVISRAYRKKLYLSPY